MTRSSATTSNSNGRRRAAVDDIRAICEALVTITRRGSSQARHRSRQEEIGIRLSLPGAHILRECCQHGPARVSDLAEALQMPGPMVSREGNRLIADSYLERQFDPGDGRITVLKATALGRRVLDRYQRLVDGELAEVMSDWPAKDVRQFAVLLERFVDAGLRTTMGTTSSAAKPRGRRAK